MAVDFPSRVDVVPWASWNAKGAGGVTRVITPTRLDLAAVYNEETGTPTQNHLEWRVLLKAGTWSLTTVYSTQNNLAIATVTLDGAAVGTIDGYSASAVYNVVTTHVGIVVGAGGVRALRYATLTKNPAAGGWFSPFLQHITLQRTGP